MHLNQEKHMDGRSARHPGAGQLMIYKEGYSPFWENLPRPLVITSGGFDPIHSGHVRSISESADLKGDGTLVVVVNGDKFLMAKKGYVFMPINERLDIVAAMRGVDHVFLWDDGTQNICELLIMAKPDFYTKGGDRSNTDIPEFGTCRKYGIRLVLGVGGYEKIQSSAKLVEAISERS